MSQAEVSRYDLIREIPARRARTFLELENKWHVQYCRKYNITIGELTPYRLDRIIRRELRGSLVQRAFPLACRLLNYDDYDFKHKYILIKNFLAAQSFYFRRYSQSFVIDESDIRNERQTTTSLYLLSKEVLQRAISALLAEGFLSRHLSSRLQSLHDALELARYVPGTHQDYSEYGAEDETIIEQRPLLAHDLRRAAWTRPSPLDAPRLSEAAVGIWWTDALVETPEPDEKHEHNLRRNSDASD